MLELVQLDKPQVHEVQLLHGVHEDCQPSEPYFTGCGLDTTEQGRHMGDDLDLCVVCWSLEACTLCGEPLTPRIPACRNKENR